MNIIRNKSIALLVGSAVGLGACNFAPPLSNQVASATALSRLDSLDLEEEEDIAAVGEKNRVVSTVFLAAPPDSLPDLTLDAAMQQALDEQLSYLRRPEAKKANFRGLRRLDLVETLQRLRGETQLSREVLDRNFDFLGVDTDLKQDRVRMTGYYTPVVRASRVREGNFKYAFYRKPKTGAFGPNDIGAGVLEGQGLELGWVEHKHSVENAQLQGSVLLEFEDGRREYLGFGGVTRGSGGAYVYFQKVDNTVLGAGSFPMTAGYSIAIDTRFVPIGATLLAELPDLDRAGRLMGYKYRVLFAQDRGGAIKTTKRIDIYCGVGEQALMEAHKINGHGRLWLMLPKRAGAPVL
jgi:membrane-bound lytic murein transglycosylase A